MTITADEFDTAVGKWNEWQSTPWGRLLYRVSQSNLARHLSQSPLRVLDVGGGNGTNSIFLAKQGHSVAWLDYSPAMLVEARQAAEQAGVADHISFHLADAGSLKERFQGQQFDLVLCHLMVEFTPQPREVLQQICDLLAPQGVLSLLDANRYSDVYLQAFQFQDLPAALGKIGTKGYFHPWFNRLTPLYSSAEMIGFLQTRECKRVGDYGVLCVCAYLPNEPKYEAGYYSQLEQLELELTDKYPYKLLARFYQVIVKKQCGVADGQDT